MQGYYGQIPLGGQDPMAEYEDERDNYGHQARDTVKKPPHFDPRQMDLVGPIGAPMPVPAMPRPTPAPREFGPPGYPGKLRSRITMGSPPPGMPQPEHRPRTGTMGEEGLPPGIPLPDMRVPGFPRQFPPTHSHPRPGELARGGFAFGMQQSPLTSGLALEDFDMFQALDQIREQAMYDPQGALVNGAALGVGTVAGALPGAALGMTPAGRALPKGAR